MPNPFYNVMNKPNPMAMLNQLKSNPVAFLRSAGLNIPQNLTDPNAIIQHLMNSGQISQQQFDRARQMAQSFNR